MFFWNFKQGEQWGSGYRINPSAALKTIDLSFGGREGRGSALGIYKLEGDRLMICLAEYRAELQAEQRPTEFAIGPGLANVLFTLSDSLPRQTWSESEETGQSSAISRMERPFRTMREGPPSSPFPTINQQCFTCPRPTYVMEMDYLSKPSSELMQPKSHDKSYSVRGISFGGYTPVARTRSMLASYRMRCSAFTSSKATD